MMDELLQDLRLRGIEWSMRSVNGCVCAELTYAGQIVAKYCCTSAYMALTEAMMALDWRQFPVRRVA